MGQIYERAQEVISWIGIIDWLVQSVKYLLHSDFGVGALPPLKGSSNWSRVWIQSVTQEIARYSL